MHFALTSEQSQIQALAQEFARDEILPLAVQADRTAQFPLQIHRQALELGLLNTSLPSHLGGPGLGALELVLITEALCHACLGIGTALCINALASEPLLLAGTPEQQKKYLGRLTDGAMASFALTEPAAGSDVAGIRSRAQRVSGGYSLSGSKIWISNASLAEFLIIFAKTDPDQGHKGMTAFIVPANAPGLSIGLPLSKLGQKAAPTNEVFMDQVFVPDAQRLGAEGSGFKLAMQVFDRSRPMVAAFGVGLTQRCLDEALGYARQRHSMGSPILEHQAIAHKLAEMRVRLESSRLLCYQSASLLDAGKSNTLEAAMAKLHASDSAMWAASETIQVMGGMGYSTEYPAEKLFRDAKVLQIYEGTSEIQKNIIARAMR
ncbi:acyl-CoA dehydrogenase family protein [Alcaligenes endophyticus]|uniref:Acyl-CoA dehydrogenase family protein n=1 Tax=Alcaligenes endophyticus TaxID=1929088 RepID=A0ABT8EJI2_9BURK|nr:acyl-CoA dehydrogenase family protein [Alcaligenes endophyticus]MCX5591772.1 acyl-CoA dehydrogenase family protein [Alcaligenes endophyticus]MDN4121449.1 acyl-CoA dehydrogenase family protein [Alcaligenes endophyticus]